MSELHQRRRRRCVTAEGQPHPSKSATAHLWVDATPPIRDARELQTLLTTSLRALWGNLERYSATLQVERPSQGQGDDDCLVVSCPRTHAPYIQAALTCVTPPPYLEDTLYRLDVVEIEYSTDDNDAVDDDSDDD